MSKLKVSGNASGTGVITLEAPNTNTDRAITLPDGDISFGVGIDDNATSTAITIDASENVGIGTTTPTTKLDVAGSISGNGAMNISGSGWGVLPYVANSLVVDSVSGATRLFATGTDATTDGSFKFYTGQTDGGANERLNLTNDGRGLSQFTCMAWANIGLDNVAAGNSSPGGSLNVSSVTLSSTGNAVFNFTNNISSANVASLVNNNTAGGTAIINGTSTSNVNVTTYHSNGNATNASLCNITTHGGS